MFHVTCDKRFVGVKARIIKHLIAFSLSESEGNL